MLERMRFISVSGARNLAYGKGDLDLAPSNLAEGTSRGDDETDVLEQAMHSNYAQATRPLMFLVARGGRYDGVGALVYEDEYVTVYSIARD
jgi:hypothetical protein